MTSRATVKVKRKINRKVINTVNAIIFEAIVMTSTGSNVRKPR